MLSVSATGNFVDLHVMRLVEPNAEHREAYGESEEGVQIEECEYFALTDGAGWYKVVDGANDKSREG